MQIELTPDQQALIAAAVASGRFDCEEDAVLEALAHWEQRERWHARVLTDAADAAPAPRKVAPEREKRRAIAPLVELPLFPA
jgi:Arc/MetJ-type ribon-helix-helix transcriptional regulator